MKKIKWGITLFGIMSILLIMNACENEKAPTGMNDTDIIQTFPEMAGMEDVLVNLASVMPAVMNDPELSKIIYDAAKVHEEDEPYALWAEFADKPSQSGKTIRRAIQQINANRKTTASTTSLYDSLDYLQVYIHSFEMWDGVSPLPVTYTPLTINDVDVTKLTLFDSLGNSTFLEVDTVGPVYPIAIIGLNESAAMANDPGMKSLNDGNKKVLTGPTIRITKLNLDWSANNYEPWWYGKAEIYFVHYVPTDPDDYTEENFNFALGHRTGYKKYKVWKWSSYHYVQTKPWRTIDLNTSWDSDMFSSGSNYKLMVIEYDFPFYDRGADIWCNFAAVISYGISLFAYEFGHDASLLVSAIITLFCEHAILNDDKIGEKMGFENIATSLFQNPNTVQEWSQSGRWKIKLKAQ